MGFGVTVFGKMGLNHLVTHHSQFVMCRFTESQLITQTKSCPHAAVSSQTHLLMSQLEKS